MDLTIAGDLLAAGAALAGLVLVFLGGVLNAYDGYDTTQQVAVKKRYRLRAWSCLLGFVLAVLGSVFSFLARLWQSQACLHYATLALAAALVVLLLLALVEVLSI
jgi:hypothetical protein